VCFTLLLVYHKENTLKLNTKCTSWTSMHSTFFVKIVACDDMRDWIRVAEENCAAGSSDFFLLTFRDNLSVPCLRVKNYWLLTPGDGTDRMSQNASKKVPPLAAWYPRRGQFSSTSELRPEVTHEDVIFWRFQKTSCMLNVSVVRSNILPVY
jgi:hypothetical protein